MVDDTSRDRAGSTPAPKGGRDARLGSALRANLARRKAQARARKAAQDDAPRPPSAPPRAEPGDTAKD